MCIGACDRAPVMQVNLEFHENMTPEAVDALLDELKRTGGDHIEEDQRKA